MAWCKSSSFIPEKDGNVNDAWVSKVELNSFYLTPVHYIEQGCGDQTALIYDSLVTNSTASCMYSESRDEGATIAGALDRIGVSKGGRVIIHMPMIPQASDMPICARIGAIDLVVYGGFAAKELATRIDDATPKVIFCES